jgi:hypothetical protein
MIGSLHAAEATNGKAIAQWRGLPCRFLLPAMLVLLAACSASPTPPSAAVATATAPIAGTPAPRNLTGLSATEVVALYGEPDFRRVEPPAELWQYRTVDCVLDLFLYRDRGGFHVVRSETRDRSLIQSGTGRCAGASDPMTLRIRQSRL